jgi:hypothetical protein
MCKILFAPVRGPAAAAEGEVIDRSALPILDRQIIRNAATAVERGKRAPAGAVAQVADPSLPPRYRELETFGSGRKAMRVSAKALLTIFHVGIAGSLLGAGAQAQIMKQNVQTIALKSGETTDLGALYSVSNCKSILKSAPEVEVLDGPPGVTVSVKEDMVLPRASRCASRVKGGTLVITAKDIEDPSFGELTVRITYHTRDGDHKVSVVYNISLFP